MVLLGLITSTLFCYLYTEFTPHGESVRTGTWGKFLLGHSTNIKHVCSKKTDKHDWPQILIPGNDLWTGICICTLEYFDSTVLS